MRTFYTILIGIMLLLVILFISRILRGRFSPTLFFILFILIWFVAMSWNMYMGIQAGYAVKEEFLIFLPLYTTNFTEPLSYQDSAFLKLPKFP